MLMLMLTMSQAQAELAKRIETQTWWQQESKAGGDGLSDDDDDDDDDDDEHEIEEARQKVDAYKVCARLMRKLIERPPAAEGGDWALPEGEEWA